MQRNVGKNRTLFANAINKQNFRLEIYLKKKNRLLINMFFDYHIDHQKTTHLFKRVKH